MARSLRTRIPALVPGLSLGSLAEAGPLLRDFALIAALVPPGQEAETLTWRIEAKVAQAARPCRSCADLIGQS